MDRFGVHHPWSCENNLRTVFELHSLLNDIWIIDIWKLLKEETLVDWFHVVSRLIWIYTVIKPEAVNLLKISWFEFAVLIILLLILQNFFQSTYFLAYTIFQPCNKVIVIKHIMEIVRNEFHSFSLVFLQVSFEFLQDTFSNNHQVISLQLYFRQFR